ncbi:MAG: hypothetical protein WC100_05735 [Sterolibacterium sp.]
MNAQQRLFFDDIYDAIRVTVQALGGNKPIGAKLWPEKSPDAAGRQLADCLNEHKAEKLSPDQVLLIMKWGREVGCHALASYYGQECGYDFTPVDPEVERDRLADSIQEASRTLERLIEAAGRIPANVRRVA